LDFIKAIEADKLSLNIVDSEKPIVFKDLEDANYTYVVRPLVK
jgi:DNA polymerase III sliding clamp (beta) subunit (PCNA family)